MPCSRSIAVGVFEGYVRVEDELGMLTSTLPQYGISEHMRLHETIRLEEVLQLWAGAA